MKLAPAIDSIRIRLINDRITQSYVYQFETKEDWNHCFLLPKFNSSPPESHDGRKTFAFPFGACFQGLG